MRSNIIDTYKEFLSEQGKKKELYPNQSELYDSIIHHMSNIGKLLRPTIMATVHSDLDGKYKDVENYALALELIHNYSLIHDDLPAMDDDDYRRGKPTIHKIYNDGLAVLAGDYLLNEAFVKLSDNVDGNLEAINYMAKKSNDLGMLGGQIIDIDPESISDMDTILEMYTKKTSALYQIAFVVPGIINKKNKEEIDMLESLGKSFGIYFQLLDDIDDYYEDKEAGKKTAFSFLNKDEVALLAEEYKKEVFNYLNELNLDKTEELIVGIYG